MMPAVVNATNCQTLYLPTWHSTVKDTPQPHPLPAQFQPQLLQANGLSEMHVPTNLPTIAMEPATADGRGQEKAPGTILMLIADASLDSNLSKKLIKPLRHNQTI